MGKYIKDNNPYTLQFSYIPPRFIERYEITHEIIGNYTQKVPAYRGIFLTGVRGSGKTVMLGDIRNRIASRDDWVTIDLNPESNLLDSLARILYREQRVKHLFLKANIDLSVFGIGVSVEKNELLSANEEDALRMMLQILKKNGKKLLVTIDEVTYSKDVAMFSHALSSFASQNLDVFVLMTGLKENIDNIKNKKSLTFLYRAKVYLLEVLNPMAISFDYNEIFDISVEQARTLAGITRGYSLAFQALGYHLWNIKCEQKGDEGLIPYDSLNERLDLTLSEMSYEKIWSELSEKDIEILIALERLMIENGKDIIRVEDVRKNTGMTSDSFTKYRKRLIDAGILNGKVYGYLKFNLPRFEEYVKNREEFRNLTSFNTEDFQLMMGYRELSRAKQKRLMAYLEELKKM